MMDYSFSFAQSRRYTYALPRFAALAESARERLLPLLPTEELAEWDYVDVVLVIIYPMARRSVQRFYKNSGPKLAEKMKSRALSQLDATLTHILNKYIVDLPPSSTETRCMNSNAELNPQEVERRVSERYPEIYERITQQENFKDHISYQFKHKRSGRI